MKISPKKLANDFQDLFSPVLSDRQIKRLVDQGKLVDGPIASHQFQPNSIDLTMATSVSHLQPNCAVPDPLDDQLVRDGIDPTVPPRYCETKFHLQDSRKAGGRLKYLLEPGEFVLMATRERLIIPNGLLGFVCGRSSVARLAIQTEQAGLIDAGFTGTITLEVMNQSEYPIVLREGMRVAQVWFIKAKRSRNVYGAARHSKYNGQFEATGSRLHLDVENLYGL